MKNFTFRVSRFILFHTNTFILKWSIYLTTPPTAKITNTLFFFGHIFYLFHLYRQLLSFTADHFSNKWMYTKAMSKYPKHTDRHASKYWSFIYRVHRTTPPKWMATRIHFEVWIWVKQSSVHIKIIIYVYLMKIFYETQNIDGFILFSKIDMVTDIIKLENILRN